MDFVKDSAGSILPDFLNPWAGDEEETPEPKPTPKSKKVEKKLSKDEQILQNVDPASGVPKAMLKKYKDDYIEDEDERGRIGAMYRTQNSPTGSKIMWDKEKKQYKTDTRTDEQRNLENEIDAFNRAEMERHNSPEMVAKRQADMDRENAELRAEYEAEMRAADPRAGAAAAMQEAGLDKSSGGAGANIVVNNVDQSQSGGGGGVPIPIPIDMQSDPTLAAPAQ